ncbi:MAG: NAD(P)-dependent oxidoreductase [Deferribacteres bacterium]|nr:NAD(P)-dependent oxidoreductase [Deferribacteres bacterium]
MILITGNTGYIGMVMTGFFQRHSHQTMGLDSNYYEGNEFFPPEAQPYRQIIKDIRDIDEKDLEGVTSIVHLAALSNDPLGDINPSLTHEINYLASVRLAELAKKTGVERFIFSSSCSMYGIASNDKPLTEEGELNPITAYAKAKVNAERDISRMADDNFHPVFMRNATVYGLSPGMRLDLVVNNLVAWAYLTGKVAIMSDGTPWRPIIHVEDFCRAFLSVLEAPVEKIHNREFNVGINEENYQIKDIAEEVRKVVPDCRVEILNKTGPDERTYRVDFTRLKDTFPDFKPVWNVRRGIEELYRAYRDFKLTLEDFNSPRYFRVRWIRYLIENKKLNNDLRWN